MEFWDILDESGNKTGKIIERGQPLGEGEFHLAVQVSLINCKSEFLIQKRSMKKYLRPGEWEIAGGAVLSGEDSMTGAIREIQEELGIPLFPGELIFITRIKRKSYFFDLWTACIDFSLGDIVLQKGEVEEVKFVNACELVQVIFPLEYYSDDAYKQAMFDFLETLSRN